MSLERLEQLVSTIQAIDGLKNQVITQNTKRELANSRYEAIVQIQNYISKIAEVTKNLDWELDMPQVSIYWLNKGRRDDSDTRTKSHHLVIRFNKGVVFFEENSFASQLRWVNFCNIPKEKIYKYDSNIEDDFINLLNNWSQIKSIIDIGAEKEMFKIIQKKENEVKTFSSSYEKAITFDVNK